MMKGITRHISTVLRVNVSGSVTTLGSRRHRSPEIYGSVSALGSTRNSSVKAMAATEFELQEAKPLSEMPGHKGVYNIPVLGTILLFKPFTNFTVETIQLLYNDLLSKYGNLLRVNLGGTAVFVADPQDIEIVMKSEGKHPARPLVPIHQLYCDSRHVVKGLAHVQGEEWQKFRSPVNPRMMRVKSAQYYLPVQNEVADHLVSRIKEESIKPEEMLDVFFRYACESIAVVAFNRRLGYLDKDISPEKLEVLDHIQALFHNIAISFNFPFWLIKYFPVKVKRDYFKSVDGLMGAVRPLYKEAMEEIERKQAEGTLDPDELNFMVSLMATDKLSTEQMTSVAMDLIGAGTDSTARNLQMMLYNLARNQDKQQKLYDEIREVMGPTGPLTVEAMGKMPYLLACLRESFRLVYPVQAGTARFLPTDIVLQGYRIPAGTQINLMNQWTVMDPKHFPEPRSFLPERWLRDSDGNRINPIPSAALQPFGFGPRQCLGKRFAEQEIYLAVTKLLQNFVVELEPDQEEPEITYRIFVGTKKPLRFRFKNRK